MKNLKFILSALVALFALSASASTINVPFYDFQGRLVTDVACPVCDTEFEGRPGTAYMQGTSVYFDTTETTFGFDWGVEVCTTSRTYLAFFLTPDSEDACVVLQSETTECNRVPIIF